MDMNDPGRQGATKDEVSPQPFRMPATYGKKFI